METSIRQRASDRLRQNADALACVGTSVSLPHLAELAMQQDRGTPYHNVPALRVQLDAMDHANNGPVARGVLASLLALLIRDFDAARLDFAITDDVATGYTRSFRRILNMPVESLRLNDSYFKDLALASGRLFPTAERVVEPFSALPRSIAWADGPVQALQVIAGLFRSRGYRPLFRLHVHLSEVSSLSEETWRQTCLSVVRMLKENAGIRGVVGASWFYDPDVVKVSPHLAFIRESLRGAGVYWFRLHQDGPHSGALTTSTTRQRAYRDGWYRPQVYSLFWPRASALAWLARQESAT